MNRKMLFPLAVLIFCCALPAFAEAKSAQSFGVLTLKLNATMQGHWSQKEECFSGSDSITITYSETDTFAVTQLPNATIGAGLELKSFAPSLSASGAGSSENHCDKGWETKRSWGYVVTKQPEKPAADVGLDWTEGTIQVAGVSIFDCIRSTSTMPDADSGALLIAGLTATEAFVGDEQFKKQFIAHFPPKAKRFTVSGSATHTSAPSSDTSRLEEGGTVTLTYTVIYDAKPSDLEVIITPPGGYETWLPQAGKDENDPAEGIEVSAELRLKKQPGKTPPHKATFKFELIDTSKEPGICMNAPKKDKAKDSFDFKILQADNPDLKPAEDGQSATSKRPDLSASVLIRPYDWGAYTRLRVTATTDDGETVPGHVKGDESKTELALPLDENGNHVADAWEKQKGVYDKRLDAKWDGADDPKDQKCPGDGISLYEKYRGFKSKNVAEKIPERLDPKKKYVFVHDPDELVWLTMMQPLAQKSGFAAVSKCQVRFVDDNEWTGPGAAGLEKRIVNFNHGYGHAVDQHVLDVRVYYGDNPLVPPDWQVLHAREFGKAYVMASGILGMMWPDYSVCNDCLSPKDAYVITIYPPVFAGEVASFVKYHTRALPLFQPGNPNPPANPDAEAARLASEYIRDHPQEYKERFLRRLADVTTHEMGHGLGVHHHDPTKGGNMECVMRYFDWDFPRNPNDRFELQARNPWPDIYCTSADHTAGGVPCWKQIKVTDKD